MILFHSICHCQVLVNNKCSLHYIHCIQLYMYIVHTLLDATIANNDLCNYFLHVAMCRVCWSCVEPAGHVQSVLAMRRACWSCIEPAGRAPSRAQPVSVGGLQPQGAPTLAVHLAGRQLCAAAARPCLSAAAYCCACHQRLHPHPPAQHWCVPPPFIPAFRKIVVHEAVLKPYFRMTCSNWFNL